MVCYIVIHINAKEKSKSGREIAILGKVAKNNLTEKWHFSKETCRCYLRAAS